MLLFVSGLGGFVAGVVLTAWWYRSGPRKRCFAPMDVTYLRAGTVVADSHPEVSEQEDRLRAGWKGEDDED